MSGSTPTFEGLPVELRDEIFSIVLKTAELCDIFNLMIAIPKYREDIVSANRIGNSKNSKVIVKDFDIEARDSAASSIQSVVTSSDFAQQRHPTPTIHIIMSTGEPTYGLSPNDWPENPGRYQHHIRVVNARDGFSSSSPYPLFQRRTLWSFGETPSDVMDTRFAEACLGRLAGQAIFDCSIRKFRMVCFLVTHDHNTSVKGSAAYGLKIAHVR